MRLPPRSQRSQRSQRSPGSAVPARVPAAAAAVGVGVCCVLLTGCGAPDGLGKSEDAPSAGSQPQPETLWPAWSPASSSASDAVTDPDLQSAPEPLADSPPVPAAGLVAMDQRDVLRADPRMRRLTQRGPIDKPGGPGIRPAAHHDLTGDHQSELISAIDLESGRVVLAVYTVREGKVVPILHTSGVRPVVEAIGDDLVVRGSATDGGEQAIRYRWNGNRMITVSEVRSYRTQDEGNEPGAGEGADPGVPRRDVPKTVLPPTSQATPSPRATPTPTATPTTPTPPAPTTSTPPAAAPPATRFPGSAP